MQHVPMTKMTNDEDKFKKTLRKATWSKTLFIDPLFLIIISGYLSFRKITGISMGSDWAPSTVNLFY